MTTQLKLLTILIILYYVASQATGPSQLQEIQSQPTMDIEYYPQSSTEVDMEEREKLNQPSPDSREDDTPYVKNATSIPGAGLSIVFIFGSLLYGAILKSISRVLSIPYNPLLLISGILCGLYHKNLGVIGEAIQLISQANPTGILAIFLPVLIFESAFNTEWHIFKKLAAQSLILGILSSISSATIIMILVKLFLDPNNEFYDWDEAFIMGSILTCTDILSFVNKLKRAGTPQKLTSLLEGQSLFNYCTCVLIVEFMHYYKESNESAGFLEYLNLFMMEVGGGILLGVTVGLVAVYCIKRMIYDGILVVTLMVIFTYAIYLFAEFSTFRISGITSLAVFALYMNAFGKTWLIGETEEYVESFWGYLVFVGQTNIFMVAGVMVGSALLHLHDNSIDVSHEILSTIYVYIFVVLARFCSISIFIRYLRRFGQGINWKEILLLTTTGLKGAIGIALAMQIFKNKQFSSITNYLVLIHVSANSLITLTIHGSGAGLIVRALGLSSIKKVEYKFFKEYLFSFKANVIERLENMKIQAHEGSMIQWSEVQTQIGLPSYLAMAKNTDQILENKQFKDESKFQKSLMFKLENVLREYLPEKPVEEQLIEKSALFDLEVEFRKRFIKDLISKYWEFHEDNETTPAALMLLIQSANYDLDRQAEEIESWGWIRNSISFNIKIFSELMKVTVINELAKSYLFQYVSYCYDVVSSYIKANEQVRGELSVFYQKSEHKNEDEEILVLENILRQSEQNQKEAEFFMNNYLEPSFPEIEKEVKTRKVSFFILHTFKNIIDRNNENGQLEPNQYDLLSHIIDSKSLTLSLSRPKWEQTDLFETLSQDKVSNVFKTIPAPVLKLLSEQMGEPYTFDANEVIIDNSQIARYVFFVKKGGCMVEFTKESMVYKEPMLAGQLFGFESLVTNIYHSKVTANTMADIVQIKKSLLAKIFDNLPALEESFWKQNMFQAYKMFLRKEDISYRISHIQKDTLQALISHFRIHHIQPQVIENPDEDMIFIRGNIEVSVKEDLTHSIGSLSYRKMARQTTFTETPPPFYFVSRLRDNVIKIKESSVFLVGELDYQVFENESMRLSRNTTFKKVPKKDSLMMS